MAARQGAICGKDDLLAEVWPGVVVEEDGLVQCVGEIRRALGTDKGSLRTYPKRGYALDLPQVDAPTTRAPSPRSKWPIPRALVAVVLFVAIAGVTGAAIMPWRPPVDAADAFGGPVVAVLPFRALPSEERWDRLARAVTEDVVADLAQNAWLYVFAEAATRALPDPPIGAARAMGADYVVTGTMQVERGTAQILAGLVDTGSGRQLWAKSFTGAVGDVLALQQQASEALTGELSAVWSGPIARADKARARGRGVADLAAYELYMRGGEHMASYTAEGLAEAERLLKRAVTLEPDFGEAWAKLSLVSYNRLAPEMSEAETHALIAQGDAAAREGLRVAPDRPNVLAQAANVVRWTDPARAEAMVRRAAELAPNDADILAYLAFRAAHFPSLAGEAEGWLDRADRLNPARPDWYDWNRAVVMMVLGRYREAVAAYARAPRHIEVRAGRVAALALAGEVAAARTAAADLGASAPQFSAAWFAEAAGLHPDVAAVFARGFAIAGMGEAHSASAR
ncbi:hypothetical protein [Acuticoccus sediminis]|uniref:hypothetical protein n=1 Tax=Acuticoccus sediminis TaxID=2184697 RepID=UPI0021F50A7D|nr:hypothetical protein [Acuticoccus sediminis]